MKVLSLFFHPHDTINDALNNPNLKIAFLLVLLPTIIGAIGSLAFGFMVNWMNFIVMLFSEVVFWLFLGLVFYVVIYLFKREHILDLRKNPKETYFGIISALSLIKVIGIIITIIAFFLPFTLTPVLFNSVVQLQNGKMSATTFAENFNAITSQNPDAVNVIGLLVLVVLGAVLVLFTLYVYYVIIAQLTHYGIIKNVVLWIILLIITFLISI